MNKNKLIFSELTKKQFIHKSLSSDFICQMQLISLLELNSACWARIFVVFGSMFFQNSIVFNRKINIILMLTQQCSIYSLKKRNKTEFLLANTWIVNWIDFKFELKLNGNDFFFFCFFEFNYFEFLFHGNSNYLWDWQVTTLCVFMRVKILNFEK